MFCASENPPKNIYFGDFKIILESNIVLKSTLLCFFYFKPALHNSSFYFSFLYKLSF